MKQDPLALAFFGAALAVLAGLLLYLFFFKTPEPATPDRAFSFVETMRRQIAELTERLEEKTAPKPTPPAAKPAAPAGRPAPAPAVAPVRPSAPVAQAGADPGYPVWPPPADMTWTYRVSVEPQLWQDAVLIYRVSRQRQRGALVVDTDFRHAKGNMTFRLGTFQAGHPSHANTRFPGFFFYAAYFGDKIRIGQDLVAEWPWQLPGGGIKAGRTKRFEGKVTQAEQYSGPVFPMASMLRIEGRLSYIEDGQVQAVARETLWYAGKAAQLVRIEREGRTPDEGATRIVAELVEMR